MILLKNNYYEEDEKLFSTGDSELDDLLEEVYYSGISDGYDYAQREFAISASGLAKEVGFTGKKVYSLIKGKAKNFIKQPGQVVKGHITNLQEAFKKPKK